MITLKLLFLKNSTFLFLVGVILLGSFVRLYKIGEIPHGFFADEASIGYNAYTIMSFGKDEYGISFPFFFKAFGEYKNPIETYSSVPFIFFLGLNEIAVRVPSAIFGIITIPGIYLLTKRITKGKPYSNTISILAALFLAVSPWHIHFSRVALEGLTAFICFTTYGLYFFLVSVKRNKFLPASVMFFTLALYSYFPARLFIPVFCVSVFLLYIRSFINNKKMLILSFSILVIMLIPMITHLFSKEGLSRWEQVSIFAQKKNTQEIITHITYNYITHFSTDFLFIKGDSGMDGQYISRHSVRGIGELYFIQFPLLLLGICYLFLLKDKRYIVVFSFFLIFYPVGSMFTNDQSAQATRSIIGVIPFSILTALGIGLFLKMPIIQKYYKIFLICVLTIFSVYFFSYYNSYFYKYPIYSSDFWGWQYGPREIVSYFVSQEKNYDELILIPEFNSPEIFFMFYTKGNCSKCIIGTPDQNYSSNKKQLFAVTSNYLKAHPFFNFKVKRTIIYPNGNVAFQIGTVVQ